MSEAERSESLAAVDLGSNSFHMVLGRVIGGQISLIDRLREPVRLASGLSSDGELDEAAVERALECLQRFSERLRDVNPEQVRVVGTSTLRRHFQGHTGAARTQGLAGYAPGTRASSCDQPSSSRTSAGTRPSSDTGSERPSS